eukprot:385610_1
MEATNIQNDAVKVEAKNNNPWPDQPMPLNTKTLSISMEKVGVGEMIRFDAERVNILQTEQYVSSPMDPDHDALDDDDTDGNVRTPLAVTLQSGSGTPRSPSISPVIAPPSTIYNPKHKWNKLIRNPLFFGRLFVLILSLILLALSIAYCIGQLLTVRLDLVRKCTPKTSEEIWAHSHKMSQKNEYYDTDGTFIMNEESQWGYTMEDCWTTKAIDISTDRVWHQNQFYPQWDFDQMTPMAFAIAVLFGFNALFCVVVIVYNLITIVVDIMWLSRHQLHTKSEYFSTQQTNTKGTNERAFSRVKDVYRTYFDDDTTGWIILHIVGELLEFFIQTSALLLYGGYNMWDPHHSNDIYLANKPEFIIVFSVILSFNLFGSGVLWLSYALAPKHCFGTVFKLTIFIIDKFSDLCYTIFPFYIVLADTYNKNTGNVLLLLGQLHIHSGLAFVAAFMPLVTLTVKSLTTTRSAQKALHNEYYAQWKCVTDIARHKDDNKAQYSAQLDGFTVTSGDLAQKEIYDSSGKMTLQLKSNVKHSWIHKVDTKSTTCTKRMFLITISLCFIASCAVILSLVTSYMDESKAYCSLIEEAKYYDVMTHNSTQQLSPQEAKLFETNPELFFWDECIYRVYAFGTDNRCQCRVFEIDWTKQISSEKQRTNVFNISQPILLDKMLSNWIMLEKFRTIGSEGSSVFLMGNNVSFPAFSKLRAFEWQDAQIESIHGIASCSRLEYLQFRSAAISSLPDDFGGLKEMKYLSLMWNAFTEVPSSICHLTELRVLQMEFEAITSIPHCIGNLTELTEVLLDGCILLSDIPLSLFGLPKLADLSLFKADFSYEDLLTYNMPYYGVEYVDNDTVANAEWFNDHFLANMDNQTTYWLALSPICDEDPAHYPTNLQSLIATTCDYPCESEFIQDVLCPPRMYGDGYCDVICQAADCYMDGGDCVQLCFSNYTNCTWDKLFNDVCDEGCDNRYCMQYPATGDLQVPTTTRPWIWSDTQGELVRGTTCYVADNFNCEMHTNGSDSGECLQQTQGCAESESIYIQAAGDEQWCDQNGCMISCDDEWIGDGECDDACRTDECFQDKGDCERGCLGGTEISACFGLWKAWTVLIGEGIYKINHSYACNVILPLGLAWLDIDASVDDCWGKVTYYDWNFDSHINFREFVIVARNFAGAGRTKSVQLNCSACSGVENYNV